MKRMNPQQLDEFVLKTTMRLVTKLFSADARVYASHHYRRVSSKKSRRGPLKRMRMCVSISQLRRTIEKEYHKWAVAPMALFI